MLKPIAFANAATIVAAGYYVLCALFSSLMPGLFVSIFQSWIHTLSFETLQGGSLTLGSALLGVVSFSLFTWVSAYALAFVYNHLAKK